MIYEVKNIELDFSKINVSEPVDAPYKPYLKVFVPNLEGDEKKYNVGKRPTVLVLPGGGYSFTSDREAEPIAMRFLARGFNVCILYYSVKTALFPVALLEALSAVKYIRENLEAWQGSPDKVYVCGFSAGGHLAASVGVFWDKEVSKAYFGDTDAVKPNGLILSYPVITSNREFTHGGSINNLLGKNKDNEEMREMLSLEKQVTKTTPPAFLWTTFEDTCVPCENTMMFASALRKCGIPFEMHIFEKGPHGGATGDLVSCVNKYRFGAWLDLACDWCEDTRSKGI
ncbi:MAG: alpha/beta hydrolase [Clostridia bacterium]|nr:alpha/beta hydrolase [Clostridia bacterium]